MAYIDELEVGDKVTVTDLRRGTSYHGEIVELPTAAHVADERVIVRYDNGTMVRVGPGFVTPDVGE